MTIDSLMIGIQTLVLLVLAREFAPSPVTLSGVAVGLSKIFAASLPINIAISVLAGRPFDLADLLVFSAELSGVAIVLGMTIKGLLRRVHVEDANQ